MEKQKFPTSVIFFIAIVVGLVVFFTTKYYTKKEYQEKHLKEQKTVIKNDLKSLTDKRDSITKKTVEKQKQAVKLIKKIPSNEKPIIRDTAYTAMCEYVSNYKSE